MLHKELTIDNGVEGVTTSTKKTFKPVAIKAKNAPYGSFAAGCNPTYGDAHNCYICDYGG